MNKNKIFTSGSGGGDKPSNDQNTLFSTDAFEMVLGLSEGPIHGLDGETAKEQLSNLFMNDVPVMSQTGKLNFEKSDFVIRYESGLPTTDIEDPENGQSRIHYFLGGQSTPNNVSASLQPQVEVIRQTPAEITGQFDRIELRLLVSQLFQTTDKGIKKDSVPLRLRWRYLGEHNWKNIFQGNLYGKTTVGGYVKSYSFAVNDPTRRVELSVTVLDSVNIDPEKNTHNLSWLNYETELVMRPDNPEHHVNTAMLHLVALIGNEIEQLPTVTGIWKGLMCKMPSNYDPKTKTYDESSPWDGSFKSELAWTDNPFWIAYELITNTNFGMYKYNPRIRVNRYSFYSLAKDADEKLVTPEGLDAHRYTFNALLNDQQLGLDLINLIIGSAYARLIDGENGELILISDRNTPAVATLAPEQCLGDEGGTVFTYSHTDLKDRINEITTTYIAPDLDWESQAIGPFSDVEAQIRQGVNTEEYNSIGCIYEDEVKRKAFLRLISYQTEIITVNFMLPSNASVVQLYDIVNIVDPDQNWGLSGRISTYDREENVIHLRDPLFFEAPSHYQISFPLKEGGEFVTSIYVPEMGLTHELNLKTQKLPDGLAKHSPFYIQLRDTDAGLAKPFRILSIRNSGEDNGAIAVTAVEVNRLKWDAADNYELTDAVQYNFVKQKHPEQPRNVHLIKEEFQVVDGKTKVNLWVGWDAPTTTFLGHYYEVSLNRNGVDLGVYAKSSTNLVELPELEFGSYEIKVTMVYAGQRVSSEVFEWEINYLSFVTGAYDPNRLDINLEGHFLGANLLLNFSAFYTYNQGATISLSDLIVNKEIQSVELKIRPYTGDEATDALVLKTINTLDTTASFSATEHLEAHPEGYFESLEIELRLLDLEGNYTPVYSYLLVADEIPQVTDIIAEATYKALSAIPLFDEITTEDVMVEWYIAKVPEGGLDDVRFANADLVATAPKLIDYIHVDNLSRYAIWAKSISALGETQLYPAANASVSDLEIVTIPILPIDELTGGNNNIGLDQLSEEAQNLIEDMNQQVDRLRPDTVDNLPSLIVKNIDAITGINSKVEVLDPENPTGLPAKIGELTSIVDVINTENPNNLQGQLEESKTQITNLNRVTDVLNPESPTGLPATVKASQASIAQQQANQEDLALSVIGVAADYTSWRTEYERRALKGEVLIDAAVYIDPKSGKITNRAFAYTDQSFNSATLRIDGVVSKIELTAKELTSTQKRMTSAEAELVVQAGKISQRATFSEVESQIAGALEALQPAYSWQFNSGSEGFNADSHNPDGFIVSTQRLTSPTVSYDALENPVIRVRVRKHASASWVGDVVFSGSSAPLHLPEPTGSDWETVSIDATGAAGYTGTITRLEFNLGACDIDFIEIGKRSANDLALKDITARTTTLETELNAVSGTITQLAKTSWVEEQGYQTQSDVSTKIDSFNTTYNVSAILQELTANNVILKANAAQTWIDGAAATITNQVSTILNSKNGVNDRIGVAEQTLNAISGEIAQTITQVSGLEIDTKDKSINDILTAYNQMALSGDLAAQGVGLASAQEKLSAVNNELESVAKQSVDLAVAFNKNTALFNGLNVAFANERTASSKTEQNLRAEIKREGTQSVAAANERLEAVVGYCVNASGERVDQVDATQCELDGNTWIDGPLVERVNNYTAVFVDGKGYQTANNVQEYVNTFDAEHGITAIIQQINDEGIITAAKEAQQWINASEGTITNMITQFVNKPDGINSNLAFAYDLIQANADENQVTATAQEQIALRLGTTELDLKNVSDGLVTEAQARATQGSEIRLEFNNQDTAMLATATDYTRAITGYCVNSQGERVDQEDAELCIAAGHNWVDGPAVSRAIKLSAAYVDAKGYQTQSDVSTKIDSFNTTYNVSAILQEITDNNIIVKANAAQTWVNGAEATITNQVSSILNSENGVNERIGVAEQTLDAIGGEIAQTITQVSGMEIDAKDKSINDILTAYNQMILGSDLAAKGAGLASAQEKLSAVNSEMESVAKQSVDLAVAFNKNTALFSGLNVAFANERTASSKTEQNLRAEIKREGTQSVAAANERLEAVVGYCVNASGERVDQVDATQCELDGNTWIDGPLVERVNNYTAVFVDAKGYQNQRDVTQALNTFDTTYKVSATLQKFTDSGTLEKANNAQQFIDGAEAYIENRIVSFNAADDSVDSKFTNVVQRLDAAEGVASTSIAQITGLELDLKDKTFEDIVNEYNKFANAIDVTKVDVKASFADEKLRAQTTELESIAEQSVNLAALFNKNAAIINSVTRAVANDEKASVIRDERYKAQFEENTARFSDVTHAITTIDEANVVRDQEMESFVFETVSSLDEVAQTFASQEQAYTTLGQTLTAKIGNDTLEAKNAAIATAQQYTRTAVGYCVNAQGQISSESDAVACVAAGGSWVAGPLAEFIENLQISEGGKTASIKQMRQVFKTVGGELVARGGWQLDNNGRAVGVVGYNDGQIGNLDLVGDVIRQGVMVGNTFVPTSYVDNTDPANPVHIFKGRMVLGDGHTVESLDDIKAQDGKDGKDGQTGPRGFTGPEGADGNDGATGPQGYQGPAGANGQVGAGFYTATVPSISFYYTTALSRFREVVGRAPVEFDIFTQVTADGQASVTRIYKFDSAGRPYWHDPEVMINGDLIATGSINGDRFQARTEINAPIIRGGTIIGIDGDFTRLTAENDTDLYATFNLKNTRSGYSMWATSNNSACILASSNTSHGVIGRGPSFAFYAQRGAYGPFTGGHDSLILKTETVNVGDIICDGDLVNIADISNAILTASVSSYREQRSVRGVFVIRKELNAENVPAALKNYKGSLRFQEYKDAYDLININAVGEGAMNVCGEGGDLEVGDYICSSNLKGKGMKQPDQSCERPYTIAQVRHNVKFKNQEEVKQVAVIYLRG